MTTHNSGNKRSSTSSQNSLNTSSCAKDHNLSSKSWYEIMEEEEAEEANNAYYDETDESEDNVSNEIKEDSSVPETKIIPNQEKTVSSETKPCELKVYDISPDIKIKMEPPSNTNNLFERRKSEELYERRQPNSEKIKTELGLTDNITMDSLKSENPEASPFKNIITDIKDFHMVTPVKQDLSTVRLASVKMTSLDSKDEGTIIKVENKSTELGNRSVRIVKTESRKRTRDSSSSSNTSECSEGKHRKFKKKTFEIETDQATLARRQKQIDYGKNTIGYDRYIAAVPKHKRQCHHPKTPPKHLKYSRRGWDGMVKIWRQQLHLWDEDDTNDTKIQETSPVVKKENENEQEESLLLTDDNGI